MTNKLKLKLYEIPFVKPVKFGDKLMSVRKGILIFDTDKQEYVGDIAPLENFSEESLQEAYNEAKLVLKENVEPKLPSVQFGFSPGPPIESGVTVCLNALITGEPETWVKQILELYEQGFRVFKIKIARGNLDLEIKNLKKISQIFKNFDTRQEKIELRLDANRKFEIKEFLDYLSLLEKHKIEHKNLKIAYIEEPVKNIWELLKLDLDLKFKLALDESLVDLGESLNLNNIAAFVIKPTLIGSLEKIESLVKLAKNNNIYCVFSSCFESGVGLRQVAKLATYYDPNSKTAHGLGTYQYFREDMLEPPFRGFRAKYHF